MFSFWLSTYLIIQAVLGWFMIQWAWGRMEKIIEVDEERDKNFPCWRRNDAKNWAKWKFIPGALLVMPTRVFGWFIILLVHCFVLFILQIGRDNSKPLRKGLR